MAAISVTHTFTNGTAADATEVNQNFDDIVQGLSDGTKDVTVSALTANGAATFNGTVALGNATGDDITVTGRVASHVDPKTASTYDLGDATQLWRGFYGNDAFLDRGAVGSPSHTFHEDTDTGGWSSGANIYNISAGGTEIAEFDTTSVDLTVPLVATGLTINGSAGLDGAVTINDAGADVDMRVEGDTDTNLIFVDASQNNVGIGTGSPDSDAKLHVSGVMIGTQVAAGITAAPTSQVGHGCALQVSNSLVIGSGSGQEVAHALSTGLTIDVTGDATASNNAFKIRFATANSSHSPNSTVLSIANDGTLTASATNDISDAQAKSDIQDLGHGLETLKKLTPREYLMKLGESGRKNFGFVAQEIEKVLPNLVTDRGQELDDTMMKAMYYKDLHALQVKSIQELAGLVEQQSLKIIGLEKKLTELN